MLVLCEIYTLAHLAMQEESDDDMGFGLFD
jgi:hypothetical protein